MTDAVESAAKIVLENVTKRYLMKGQEFLALSETNLTVQSGEFICLVGPTGCGKTTLLNMIGGLESVSGGRILVSGNLVKGPGRDRGIVFQQYALFPWLSVRKNIEFALRLRGVPKTDRASLARHYLALVNLNEFADALPKQLSGGMKQRVAIARAYAAEPEVLLMDEPFGALDAETKAQLQEDLLRSWRELRSTIIFITHDVEEAIFLAQRVIVMAARPGRVKRELTIDLPEVRDQSVRFGARLLELKNEVWRLLHEQE